MSGAPSTATQMHACMGHPAHAGQHDSHRAGQPKLELRCHLPSKGTVMQARMSARQTIGTNPGVSRRCHGKQRTGGTCVALALIIGPATRHCKPMAGVVFVATLAAFGLGVIAHCGRQRRVVLVGVGVGALATGVLHSIQERVCRARARAQASGGALRAPGCGGRAPARLMHVRRRVPRLALARVAGAWHAERRCVPHRRVRRAQSG